MAAGHENPPVASQYKLELDANSKLSRLIEFVTSKPQGATLQEISKKLNLSVSSVRGALCSLKPFTNIKVDRKRKSNRVKISFLHSEKLSIIATQPVVEKPFCSVLCDKLKNLPKGTKITVNLGIDTSSSMFVSNPGGSSIKKATIVVRLLRKVFQTISLDLLPYSFDYGLWLWSVGDGRNIVWLAGSILPLYNDYVARILDHRLKDPHFFLGWLGDQKDWVWAGGNTLLEPLLKQWSTPKDSSNYQLDIVITDSKIFDVDACDKVQRTADKSLLLNISDWVGEIPAGFTQYYIRTTSDLAIILKEELLGFIQTIGRN